MIHNAVEEYKKDVGFYSLAPVGDTVGVRLNWPEFINETSGLASEWGEIDESELEIADGRVSRSWYFAGPDSSMMSIDVSILDNAQSAREEVIRLTAESMMLSSPFKTLKNDAGDFAVGNLNSEYNKFVWSTANLVLVLYYQPSTHNDGGRDLVERLDTIIKKHLVEDVRSSRPEIATVKVSSQSVSVGENVDFEVALKPYEGNARIFVIDPEWRLSAESKFTFEAVTEGVSKVLVMAVDEKTMLFSEHKIDIRIKP